MVSLVTVCKRYLPFKVAHATLLMVQNIMNKEKGLLCLSLQHNMMEVGEQNSLPTHFSRESHATGNDSFMSYPCHNYSGAKQVLGYACKVKTKLKPC